MCVCKKIHSHCAMILIHFDYDAKRSNFLHWFWAPNFLVLPAESDRDVKITCFL